MGIPSLIHLIGTCTRTSLMCLQYVFVRHHLLLLIIVPKKDAENAKLWENIYQIDELKVSVDTRINLNIALLNYEVDAEFLH